MLVAAAVVLAAHGVLGHPVPGADQLGRGFDPATGADVGMIFKIDSAVPSNSALFPESTLPAGFVLSSSPEQLMAPKTKIVATYRSYVNMRSAQVGLPVSAGGFFALSDEAKNMQTVRQARSLPFKPNSTAPHTASSLRLLAHTVHVSHVCRFFDISMWLSQSRLSACLSSRCSTLWKETNCRPPCATR